jgi:hypothetical protein
MFGVEKRVERVRQALIRAFQAKSIEIMTAHADKKPADIPRHDLARSMVLHDLAEILTNLRVEKTPEDEG